MSSGLQLFYRIPSIGALCRGPLSLEARDKILGFVLLSPTLIFFFALIVYPIIQILMLSFKDINTLTLKGDFVGFKNYIYMLQQIEFWISFRNTMIWTISALFLQLILGVAMALALHGKIIFQSVARGLVLFPYLLTTAVVVLIWQWLFSDLYGYLNYLFVDIGILSRPIAWLAHMPNAMISVIVVGTWKWFPFVVIAVLARLQTIPEHLYDAAKIDGASPWAQFWDITVPQLKSLLIMVILLRSIWDFKEFDLIYLLTGGGPQIGTQTLPVLVYKQAFPLLDLGKGAAVAVLMMVFMLFFVWLSFHAYKKEELEGR